MAANLATVAAVQDLVVATEADAAIEALGAGADVVVAHDGVHAADAAGGQQRDKAAYKFGAPAGTAHARQQVDVQVGGEARLQRGEVAVQHVVVGRVQRVQKRRLGRGRALDAVGRRRWREGARRLQRWDYGRVVARDILSAARRADDVADGSAGAVVDDEAELGVQRNVGQHPDVRRGEGAAAVGQRGRKRLAALRARVARVRSASHGLKGGLTTCATASWSVAASYGRMKGGMLEARSRG